MHEDHALRGGRVLVYRHPLLIRLTHWINAICLALLFMSGLQIFNAHPALYWGEVSHFETPLLAIEATQGPAGEPRGVLRVGSFELDTTGVLGVSEHEGRTRQQAFPSWITLPSYHDLGEGRRWHFFFAWIFAVSGAVYVLFNLLSRRFSRSLWPSWSQVKGIGRSIWEHLRLHVARGEEARHYNVLQKLTYLAVMFGLLPLMVATGLAMSPTMNAALPWLTDVLGGRQSARTLHFIAASLLVTFFIVHIAMVLVSGPLNELRSIITGWFVIRPAQSETTVSDKASS